LRAPFNAEQANIICGCFKPLNFLNDWPETGIAVAWSIRYLYMKKTSNGKRWMMWPCH